MSQSEPEPLDESLPPAETRGGNRPEDYMPLTVRPFAPLDVEEAFDDGPMGGNDPDAQ